jgi:hypothetical protein
LAGGIILIGAKCRSSYVRNIVQRRLRGGFIVVIVVTVDRCPVVDAVDFHFIYGFFYPLVRNKTGEHTSDFIVSIVGSAPDVLIAALGTLIWSRHSGVLKVH